jgi:hypothetical protein
MNIEPKELTDDQLAGIEADLSINWAPTSGPCSRVRPLLAHIAYLKQEEEISHLVNGRMGKILNDTANALKGPPDDLALHSTHDLAEVALRLVRERSEAVNTMTSYYDRIQKLEAANKALMHQANVANARIEPSDCRHPQFKCQRCGDTFSRQDGVQ